MAKSRCHAADLQYFALLHFSLDTEVKAGHLAPQPLTLPIHPLFCASAYQTLLLKSSKPEAHQLLSTKAACHLVCSGLSWATVAGLMHD